MLHNRSKATVTRFQKGEATTKPVAREAESMLTEGGMGKGRRQSDRDRGTARHRERT